METAVQPEWFAKLESWTSEVNENDFREFSIPEGRLRLWRTSIVGEGSRAFIVELIEQGKEKPHEQFQLDATGVFNAGFEYPPIIPYPPADIDYPAYQTDKQRQALAQRRAELIIGFIQTRLGR